MHNNKERDNMELEKQIYDEIVKRLDSIDALELVTLIYDKWGIEERHCLRRRCGPASFCMRNGSVL